MRVFYAFLSETAHEAEMPAAVGANPFVGTARNSWYHA
jgi:hypothetical protein